MPHLFLVHVWLIFLGNWGLAAPTHYGRKTRCVGTRKRGSHPEKWYVKIVLLGLLARSISPKRAAALSLGWGTRDSTPSGGRGLFP